MHMISATVIGFEEDIFWNIYIVTGSGALHSMLLKYNVYVP